VDGLESLRDSEKIKYCIVRRCVCEANIRYCKVRVSAVRWPQSNPLALRPQIPTDEFSAVCRGEFSH
jgi:hypothetical protein